MAVTDLPHPDSPTILSTSPASSENETPPTACTVPSSVAKSTFRSSISSSGPAMDLCTQPDPRVERRVDDVHDGAQNHHEEGAEHRDHQHRRDIELLDRV